MPPGGWDLALDLSLLRRGWAVDRPPVSRLEAPPSLPGQALLRGSQPYSLLLSSWIPQGRDEAGESGVLLLPGNLMP